MGTGISITDIKYINIYLYINNNNKSYNFKIHCDVYYGDLRYINTSQGVLDIFKFNYEGMSYSNRPPTLDNFLDNCIIQFSQRRYPYVIHKFNRIHNNNRAIYDIIYYRRQGVDYSYSAKDNVMDYTLCINKHNENQIDTYIFYPYPYPMRDSDILIHKLFSLKINKSLELVECLTFESKIDGHFRYLKCDYKPVYSAYWSNKKSFILKYKLFALTNDLSLVYLTSNKINFYWEDDGTISILVDGKKIRSIPASYIPDNNSIASIMKM